MAPAGGVCFGGLVPVSVATGAASVRGGRFAGLVNSPLGVRRGGVLVGEVVLRC
jgi:hypothetical protein